MASTAHRAPASSGPPCRTPWTRDSPSTSHCQRSEREKPARGVAHVAGPADRAGRANSCSLGKMAQRALLPKPGQPGREPGAPDPNKFKRKRQQVLAACSTCQTRKSKCDGRRPVCGPCATLKHQCHYTTPEGMSARDARRQRLEESSDTQRNLRAAFAVLRSGNEADAAEILHNIRQAPTLDAAIRIMSESSLPSSSRGESSDVSVPPRSRGSDSSTPSVDPSGLGQLPIRPRSGSRRLDFRDAQPAGVFNTSATAGMTSGLEDLLVNLPTKQLPISKWTKVSSDNRLLNHLMNLFWTWDSTLSRMVDRDVFLEDLKSGADNDAEDGLERAEFCSPFMVNALLAVASMYTKQEAVFAVAGDVMSRGRAFADEAARLMLLDQARTGPTVTLTQGTALLWVYESNLGNGRLGLQLLEKIFRHYSALLIQSPPGRRPRSPAGSQEMRSWKAMSHLAWGFYCVVAKIDLTFSRPMRISKPATERPLCDSGSIPCGDTICPGAWFAYPISLVPHESHHQDLFAAECDLAELVEEILIFRHKTVMANPSSPVRNEIDRLYRKLVGWRASLPNALQPSYTEVPSAILLHITHDALLLKLVEGLPPIPGKRIGGQELETLRIANATSIMAGIWTIRSLYTLQHEYWAMQGCFAAAVAVFEYLGPGTVQVDTFIRACQALAEMGELLPLANSFLAGIKGLVSKSDITLPSYGRRYLEQRHRKRGDDYASAIRVSALLPRGTEPTSDQGQQAASIDTVFAELILNMTDDDFQVD
ncbi:hypothetical protein HIM_02134 [Hirsutella minnesotensis 3608]|nr:hypothetical protein HIM_02134 [Hirsutella minnesotensis 3608]